MICVIGSGPAAVACIAPFIKQGIKVRVIDIGHRLDETTTAQVSSLATQTPAQWSSSDISRLTQNKSRSYRGIPLKLSFGSNFPYRTPSFGMEYACKKVASLPSYALGGFSNVWGGAMLPYRAPDIATWPIDVEELAPHYEAVVNLTGLAATHDDLERYFPLYASHIHSLNMSTQAESLLKDLQHSREPLRHEGIIFGRSRLAFTPSVLEPQTKCQYCTLCMSGCPYGVIFNSSMLIKYWSASGAIQYVDQCIVETIRETGDDIVIKGRTTHGEMFEEHAQRVFLAAGLLPSTAIVLRSQDRYNEPVVANDSQYFLFPLLRFFGNDGVRREKMHTLSQIFIELFEVHEASHPVHLQIYSYNDLIYEKLQKTFRSLMPQSFLEKLVSRVLVVQGYLHSDDSAKIQMVLSKSSKNIDQLNVTPLAHSKTRLLVAQVLRKVGSLFPLLKGVPLSPLLYMGEAGRGFHSGGSFPMSNNPTMREADLLGRPWGYKRLHLVDASIFPSIPATTITYSVMANAHRIASSLTKENQ